MANTELVDASQSASGPDVNALRYSVARGGTLEVVLSDVRQLADGTWVVSAQNPTTEVHHSDEVTLVADGAEWTPVAGETVLLARSAADVKDGLTASPVKAAEEAQA